MVELQHYIGVRGAIKLGGDEAGILRTAAVIIGVDIRIIPDKIWVLIFICNCSELPELPVTHIVYLSPALGNACLVECFRERKRISFAKCGKADVVSVPGPCRVGRISPDMIEGIGR